MRRRRKKVLIISIIIMLVILLVMVGMYFYSLTSVSKNHEKVTFTIETGTNTKDIISNLYDANLIRNKFASMIYVKLNKRIIIKAGTYELDRALNTKEIFELLSGNNAIIDSITIKFPEEAKVVDFAKIISENFDYSEEEILKVLSSEEYLKELINKYSFLTDEILNSDIYYPLEGYLYPDTYEFYKSASIKDIIEKLLDKTGKVLDNYSTSISESSFSIHEILTIASIIENESKIDEDRSIVSQVIYKRLSMNMSLGMDVTTYYGSRKSLKETLTQSDLNSQNAYNTRRVDFIGLPVSPICNPTERSIKAALNPSDTDYIYFYAEISTGKLHFANTFEEFQELIRKYS